MLGVNNENYFSFLFKKSSQQKTESMATPNEIQFSSKGLNQDIVNKFFLPKAGGGSKNVSPVASPSRTSFDIKKSFNGVKGASGSPIDVDSEENKSSDKNENDEEKGCPDEKEEQQEDEENSDDNHSFDNGDEKDEEEENNSGDDEGQSKIENEESHHSLIHENTDLADVQEELKTYLNNTKVQYNARKLKEMATTGQNNATGKPLTDVASNIRVIGELWAMWFPESPDYNNPQPIIQSMSQAVLSIEKILRLPLGEQTKAQFLEDRYNEYMKMAFQVQTRLGPEATKHPYSVLLSKIYDKIAVVLDIIRDYIRLCNVNKTDITPSGELALFRFQDIMSTAGGLKGAALKAFAMNEMVKRRYRRYHDDLYEPVMNSEGHMTCAWKKVTSIKDFVWSLTSIVGPNSPWSLMASKGTATIKDVIEFFKESKEPHVPYLKPDRHIFSFENGIYLAKEMKFLKWEELAGIQSIRDKTPAKHFAGQNFPDPAQYNSWKDIPTPNIDQIVITTQKWSPDLVKWLWVMIGRLLYNIKEYDDWQVVPFFFGRGMTGKSTLIQHVIRLFYDPQDIGVLSNKIEDVFGFSPLVDKFIICGDEILDIGKRWDQALMQGMLSGSSMSLGVKNKAPVIVPAWLPPFVLSGNNQLNYTDNAGSYSRRFVIFEFSVKLPMNSVDGKLASRLFDEIPAIILKANLAYREEAAVNGWSSVWNVVCPELIAQKDNLMKSANSLVDFIQSSRVLIDSTKLVPFSRFWTAYLNYCRSTNLIACKKTSDQYKTPFEDAGIKLERKSDKIKWRNQCFRGTEWLAGVDLVDDVVNESEEPKGSEQSKEQITGNPSENTKRSSGPQGVNSFFHVIEKSKTPVIIPSPKSSEDSSSATPPPNKIRKIQI